MKTFCVTYRQSQGDEGTTVGPFYSYGEAEDWACLQAGAGDWEVTRYYTYDGENYV